ncbi:uncharacterized protein AKAW2_60819A [Aspergillus luchuensis]|uniref:Uncharacterized protein n=1 Tax=Aspergillus kawachii TaxID=1069201 RepID=A0A7R7WGZ7_ASPKA|nr:uncharacterized protein AKAW2_60819A [Aspergillus luchuensis]BCS02555.1 hypothetical protein AKAW2_60819A [Aspergillus luchuensis]
MWLHLGDQLAGESWTGEPLRQSYTIGHPKDSKLRHLESNGWYFGFRFKIWGLTCTKKKNYKCFLEAWLTKLLRGIDHWEGYAIMRLTRANHSCGPQILLRPIVPR